MVNIKMRIYTKSMKHLLCRYGTMQDLKIPHDKVNVHGGACALGHPIGASGARIIVDIIKCIKKK